ncbi:MAG: helicase-associated domain-containing protein [Peptococcaceae bacterium]|nr:helicase-associated domain-containing protein [Peptococcaceae bacterium]
MSTTEQIAKYLYDKCIMGASSDRVNGTGLSAIYRSVSHSKKSPLKPQIIKELSVFYANKQNIINIWQSLSACEQDFVGYIVRYGGKEHLPTTLEYAKKHNFKLEYINKWGRQSNYLDDHHYSQLKFLHLLKREYPKSKATVLFPSGRAMPAFVLNALKPIMEPVAFDYQDFKPSKKDLLICREDRIADFAAIVRVAAGEQLKVKTGTFHLTKAKLAKLSEIIGFEEVCEREGKFCTPKEAKNHNDFLVAQPFFTLAANSGLLDINQEGFVSPGKQSTKLLALPLGKLAQTIFRDYCADNHIRELSQIHHVTNHGEWINWHECRKAITELLKTCPVGKFVSFKEFNNNAKLFCGNFMMRAFDRLAATRGYDYGYVYRCNFERDWNECEAPVIIRILAFLSAIGIVDIAYQEAPPDNMILGNDCHYSISGLRITTLGAWLLGLANKYTPSQTTSAATDDGELIVLPDYSVVISGLKCRVDHEVYFSRFLTKVSVDATAAVYKLDFPSVIRAYDQNITPLQIKTRLAETSVKPIPDNVARSLDDWQTKIGRIKIRTLTILEADDALLLEEIKHIRGMDKIITDDLSHAVIIGGDQQKKVKALIERNGWPMKINA